MTQFNTSLCNYKRQWTWNISMLYAVTLLTPIRWNYVSKWSNDIAYIMQPSSPEQRPHVNESRVSLWYNQFIRNNEARTNLQTDSSRCSSPDSSIAQAWCRHESWLMRREGCNHRKRRYRWYIKASYARLHAGIFRKTCVRITGACAAEKSDRRHTRGFVENIPLRALCFCSDTRQEHQDLRLSRSDCVRWREVNS